VENVVLFYSFTLGLYKKTVNGKSQSKFTPITMQCMGMEKEPSVPIRRTPEPVWTWQRGGKFLTLPGIESVVQPIVLLYGPRYPNSHLWWLLAPIICHSVCACAFKSAHFLMHLFYCRLVTVVCFHFYKIPHTSNISIKFPTKAQCFSFHIDNIYEELSNYVLIRYPQR
jgi:hypothetical protein